jgi:hypothetical protein
MRVSVQTTVSVVASACILAGSVASAAVSTERQQQYRPKKAAGENRGCSEASAGKACLTADPPTTWAAASQGDEINKLREAAQ